MSITAIIPAYNEEKNIGRVLDVLMHANIFSSVLVVDDGSQDHTADVARTHGALVIQQENQGKGAAMIAGARAADTEHIFFCDADVIGLKREHICLLVDPVVSGMAAMTVGLRDRGVFFTWLLPHIAPILGGERALSRILFLAMVETYAHCSLSDFGIETYMNAYCSSRRLRILPVKMQGVTQIIKEQKYGLWTGFFARMRMVWQILRAERRTFFQKR
ncbi:glycosyltransferase [Candidatus Uhrbacteria bacterium]|nr:glycosyltransferase [Candidatus Uhrbacteria bacterium]